MTDPTTATLPPPEQPQATGNYVPPDSASALVQVLDQYLAELQTGAAPRREELLARHPGLAAQLEKCLSGLEFIHRAAQPGAPPTQLGDFRIVREIGRGGMGVVYEAEQISLQRRVALKVLRFGGVADAEALARFEREARAVAHLHHTNIVPIFAVGCEQGIHYYAMQYIEGRGLETAVADRLAATGPSAGSRPPLADSREVARWTLQAAEALAHAHERGIIHRDVKPSNLLLDKEGTVWLTDFGLARRLDEVTVTAAGVLMGTPRYMSPEQASAAQQPIDHRTDIYSLGATLYELATGRPVFSADTPQGVISQILLDEPPAPRRVSPSLPKDLETIILRCLEKEPAKRYQSARALADDLRAFLEGRPIQARRVNLFERTRRWAVKHRRSALLMAGAALAAALLMFLGTGIFQHYQAWQQGGLLFWTDEQVLVGELQDGTGHRVLPRFTVPTEEPVFLPAGSYDLRLWGRGFLDMRCKVLVDRGPFSAYQLGLEEQRLCAPIKVARSFEVGELEGRHDLLLLSDEGVVRRDAVSGKDIWKADLRRQSNPSLAHFRWTWKEPGYPSGRAGYDYRPQLVKPLPDLNGDGIGDLVWASRRQAALLALSGKDGKVLWLSPDPLPENQRLSANNDYYDRGSRGSVVGVPVTADVDGDGTLDLIAAFISWDRRGNERDSPPPRRWIEAISGATGKPLWRYDLDPAWLTPADGSEVPMAARWFPGPGTSSGGGFHSDPSLLYEMSFSERMDAGPALPYPPAVIMLQRQPVVCVAVGSRLVGLELASGKEAWPAHDLGFWPVRQPQIADLRGDGTLQAVLLHPTGLPAKLDNDHLALTALDLTTRTTLWQTPFRGYYRWSWYEQSFDWPLIHDLEGARKPTIIVPTAERTERSLWSGLQAIDGSTGQVRWRKPLVLSSDWGRILQVDRFVVGPDIDGDNSLDLFAVSLDAAERSESINFPILIAGLTDPDKDPTRPVVVVDALSGKDGRGLWFARQPMSQGSLTHRPGPSLGPLRWWHKGADGAPQLVVSYVPDTPHEGALPATTMVLSAGSGTLLRTGQDLREADVADFDGDGIPELFAFRPATSPAFDDGGTIDIIRGRSPESWRLLGGRWQLAGDLDGDGIRDLITEQQDDRDEQGYRGAKDARERRPTTDTPRLRAVSGANGGLLWQTELQDRWSPTDIWKFAFPAQGPNADLNGDGSADLFAIPSDGLYVMDHRPPFGPNDGPGYNFSPLLAISGRTGQRLWAADLRVNIQMGCLFHECRDLDGDGRPEVIFVSRMDHGYDRRSTNWSSNDGQLWLVVFDGRTGKTRWIQPLNERGTNTSEMQDFLFRPVLVELNGDGVTDIVIPAGRPVFGASQVRAFSGKDGAPLWTWSDDAPQSPDSWNSAGWPRLNVGDLDGDGRPEIILFHLAEADAGDSKRQAVLRVVDGITGKERWQWRAPVDYDFNRPDGRPERRLNDVTPQLVRLDGNRQAICVWTHQYRAGSQIVLLDAGGKELAQTPVKFALGGEARHNLRTLDQKADSYGHSPDWAIFHVWVQDLDGDGCDELLWFSGESLQAVRNDLKTVLWSWPMRGDLNKILEINPGVDGRPGTILVQSDQRVQCLSAATGQPTLTCVGTGKLVGALDARAATPSRFLFDHGREAVSSSQGELHGAEPTAAPRNVPSTKDARVLRPLPWQRLDILARWARVRPLPEHLLGVTLASAGFAMLVLVMPGTLLVWGLRQRHWPSIAGALVWFTLAVLGVSLSIVLQYSDEAQWSVQLAGWWNYLQRLTINVMLVSFLGLPTVAFMAAVVFCLWRRRWAWLGALLLGSAALAWLIGWTTLTFLAPPLEHGQQYSWEGWYTVWPAGPYAVGILVLLGLTLRLLVRLSRLGIRRWFPGRAVA